MAICSMAGIEVTSHFLVANERRGDVLVTGFFSRAKSKVRSLAANLGRKNLRAGWMDFHTESQFGWKSFFVPQDMGRDRFTYCICVNGDIGKRYLLSTETDECGDIYAFLMANYKLPLKKEWMPVLLDTLISNQTVRKRKPYIYKATKEPIFLQLHGKGVSVDELYFYDFGSLTEEILEQTVSQCLSERKFCICEEFIPSLQISDMDDYFLRYGDKTAEYLDSQLKPLVELRPNVRNLALKEKYLLPQQAASVEGVLAMQRNGIHYAVLNHGMGCGKTLESIAVVEATMVEKWLKAHPSKQLKDAYAADGIITYRTIIMVPGHLLEKWKLEIESEIPYAHVEILYDFSQFVRLREERYLPAPGKMFYIMSMDFAKLDAHDSPIPTVMRTKYLSLDVCADCYTERGLTVYKRGIGNDAICPSCQGKNFVAVPMEYFGKKRGLVCPSCGELLLKYRRMAPDSETFSSNVDSLILTPKNFAQKKNENLCCYHCNAPLWGVNAKPLMLPGVNPHENPWYKVSHYTNYSKKGTTTAYVLRKYEQDYYRSAVTTDGLRTLPREYGPRKVAPAHFVKKYLKGFFDFCILDECHKYLGDSAQSVAAHALIKASKFTLALTGTISNGTAVSFYNLFFLLEPQKLLKEGYTYSAADRMRFCKDYGCVETVYSVGEYDATKNIMSRGKQLYPPRVKAGLSAVLFGKFLLDRCLFLDISDLSKYLPPFHEYVRMCKLPENVLSAYKSVIKTLKESSHGSNGSNMAILSTMLQFGLSYPDKPYDKNPIMNPYCKNSCICKVRNFDEYTGQDVLLPKEKETIDIINKEIAEGRNCFVFASFTSSPETIVVDRLQAIIENHCNLKGRVAILQSNSPKASKREKYFHELAAKGYRVIITNPKNVETGLDFCFKYKEVLYNFPTLIFFQLTNQLYTVWQASRRAYRLNQKEECRNYYLGYEDTLQAALIAIMAKKQVSTAAIQGHFSAEGLSSMAQGVDVRTQLAAALAQNDMSSKDSLENMFDVLDALNNNAEEDETYTGFTKSPTFWELTGKSNYCDDSASIFDVSFQCTSPNEPLSSLDSMSQESVLEDLSEDNMDSFFNAFLYNYGLAPKPTESQEGNNLKQSVSTTKKKKVKLLPGQQTLFDLVG